MKTNMPQTFLEESVIDMIASRWERNLEGRDEASVFELTDISERFMVRYTEVDKFKVLKMLNGIRSKASKNAWIKYILYGIL